jgi:hypothetical protein
MEFHHRNLLKNYFHIWKAFISQNQIAIEFLNHKRIKSTWTIWRIQLNKRRLHQQQFQIANEQYHRKVLSRVCCR